MTVGGVKFDAGDPIPVMRVLAQVLLDKIKLTAAANPKVTLLTLKPVGRDSTVL